MSYTVTNSDSVTDLNVTSETAKILQSVRSVLLTRKGTVPMNREYGLSQDFLDMPITLAEPLIAQDVKESIEDSVDGVQVDDIEISQTEEGKLSLTVKITIDDEEEDEDEQEY